MAIQSSDQSQSESTWESYLEGLEPGAFSKMPHMKRLSHLPRSTVVSKRHSRSRVWGSQSTSQKRQKPWRLLRWSVSIRIEFERKQLINLKYNVMSTVIIYGSSVYSSWPACFPQEKRRAILFAESSGAAQKLILRIQSCSRLSIGSLEIKQLQAEYIAPKYVPGKEKFIARQDLFDIA